MNEIKDRSALYKFIAMRRLSMKEQCGSRSPNSSYNSLLLYDQVQERLDKLLHQDPPSYNCIPMQEGLHYPELETENLHNNNKNSNTDIGLIGDVGPLGRQAQLVRGTSSYCGAAAPWGGSDDMVLGGPDPCLGPSMGTSTRWTPTQAQLEELHAWFYVGGVRTPSASQISRITAQLRAYGRIEGRNVFYWFQNQKARERKRAIAQQKLEQEQRQGVVLEGQGQGQGQARSQCEDTSQGQGQGMSQGQTIHSYVGAQFICTTATTAFSSSPDSIHDTERVFCANSGNPPNLAASSSMGGAIDDEDGDGGKELGLLMELFPLSSGHPLHNQAHHHEYRFIPSPTSTYSNNSTLISSSSFASSSSSSSSSSSCTHHHPAPYNHHLISINSTAPHHDLQLDLNLALNHS